LLRRAPSRGVLELSRFSRPHPAQTGEGLTRAWFQAFYQNSLHFEHWTADRRQPRRDGRLVRRQAWDYGLVAQLTHGLPGVPLIAES
jgi:hypothetical protein